MTYERPAYEQVTIAHGGNTVTLRPTLRAAATLEARYGFPALLRGLDELSLTIITDTILTASSPQGGAASLLSEAAGRPLFPFLIAARNELRRLVAMFELQADPQTVPSKEASKLVPWKEIYMNLYRVATGALGWTPEAAWNATPTEINEACIGKFGTGDSRQSDNDPEQAARNVADGLDPEFDRAGLRALKAKIAGS